MASTWLGAIVGKFKVGDGTVVGPPRFRPDKPKLTLKGKPFTTIVIADLKTVNLGKPKLTLRFGSLQPFSLIVSSTVTVNEPVLTLRGKILRTVDPNKVSLSTPARLTLRGKTLTVNRSYIISIGKAKLTLRGGRIGRAGKAGLVPTTPQSVGLAPTPTQPDDLVPTVAKPGLLTPTKEEQI